MYGLKVEIMMMYGLKVEITMALSLESENIQEIKQVPGGEFVKSVDALQLEACAREGTTIKIHPDQVKQWKSSGQGLDQQFEEIRAKHMETHANALSGPQHCNSN